MPGATTLVPRMDRFAIRLPVDMVHFVYVIVWDTADTRYKHKLNIIALSIHNILIRQSSSVYINIALFVVCIKYNHCHCWSRFRRAQPRCCSETWHLCTDRDLSNSGRQSRDHSRPGSRLHRAIYVMYFLRIRILFYSISSIVELWEASKYYQIKYFLCEKSILYYSKRVLQGPVTWPASLSNGSCQENNIGHVAGILCCDWTRIDGEFSDWLKGAVTSVDPHTGFLQGLDCLTAATADSAAAAVLETSSCCIQLSSPWKNKVRVGRRRGRGGWFSKPGLRTNHVTGDLTPTGSVSKVLWPWKDAQAARQAGNQA